MFNSTTVEVALGLALLYSLLSILASTINEFVSAAVEWRSKNLEIGLRKILAGNDTTGADLLDRFYAHPIIQALHTRRFFLARDATSSKKPSYIPARIFRTVVEDLIAPNGPTTVAELRQTLTALPPGGMRDALLALVDDASQDLATTRAAIEHWFDDTMDRLSGWYKRQVQVVLFAISIGLALGLNADTLSITNTLVHNPEIRAFVVARAEEVARQTPAPADPSAGPSFAKVEAALKEVGDLQLPLGWRDGWSDLDAVAPLAHPQEFLLKVAGLVVTAIAMSFGAQFWFDLLSKLVGLRAAVKPKKADEE
jgi:hypothetical protein